MADQKSRAEPAAEPTARRIIFELPPDVTLPAEEIESLMTEFRSRLIDTRSEEMVVRAKPKEKAKEVPQLVQIKEVPVGKEKAQTA